MEAPKPVSPVMFAFKKCLTCSLLLQPNVKIIIKTKISIFMLVIKVHIKNKTLPQRG